LDQQLTRLLVASRNLKKLAELRRVLDAASLSGLTLVSLDDVPPFDEAPETGATFEDNALAKARDGFAATDTVVYQAVTDTTQVLTPPALIPQSSSAGGIAPVVSILNVPHSLTILLPAVMQSDQSYAIWVQNANGEWSNGVRINDARPLWITPDSVYESASLASLPRYLDGADRRRPEHRCCWLGRLHFAGAIRH